MLLSLYPESKSAACYLDLPAQSLRSSAYNFIGRCISYNKAPTSLVHAGLMQIRCLDSLPSHLPRTYHDVGQFACGQTGRVLVSAVTTLEYFGYACMQLILLWHQLEVSMHLDSTHVAFSAQVLMVGLVSARCSHASACAPCIMQLHGFLHCICLSVHHVSEPCRCDAMLCSCLADHVLLQ